MFLRLNSYGVLLLLGEAERDRGGARRTSHFTRGIIEETLHNHVILHK